MKLKSMLAAAGAAILTAALATSCGSNGSALTKVSGTITEPGFDEVTIAVEKYDIDTLVPVNDGKFYIELPADPTEVALVIAGYYRAYFILDGTKLTLTLGDGQFTATSASKNSLQSKYNAMEDRIKEMNDQFVANVSALSEEDESAQIIFEQIYEDAIGGMIEYVEDQILENTDNAIGAIAVNKLNGIVTDEQLAYLIGTLGEEMQQSTFVEPLLDEVNARLETAEGKMFKDFTVEDSDGKTVSLSDYVGRGKYAIVDFWASWCQPCKDEVPFMRDVYAKYHPKGLEVVSVAVSDDPKDSKDTARVYGMTWNQIINAGDIPTQVYSLPYIPYIILVGPDGTILKKDMRGEEIAAEVGKYLD